MPNAIDTAKFAYDPEARTALRKEFGIPQEAFVVGHVGRFTYAKNHTFLLKIFSELLKADQNAFLLLVGEGELEGQTRRQAQALGLQEKVLFTGARRDVNKLYSVMDVFCMPSHYEGMPVVAWEAQASGLPCVFSKTIAREAEKGGGHFIELQQGALVWAKELLRKRKRMNGIVLGIEVQAHQLQKIYEGIRKQDELISTGERK